MNAALKALLTAKNSEGPALLVGLLLAVVPSFVDLAAIVGPDAVGQLGAVSTTLITYAGARAYSKGAKGDGSGQ